ncbi:hypothetical protein BT63DRAFT_442517 [Microthyrium microscopicum]|uniref:CBM1 domain-containing protein n=1 Tax=Microthyrium microscopicum TaxID=703497 RepID=A0A6A6U4N0_9PEZI|nr:hypothetical protein BT63DRAFT_442517 [Microthyrium microscopicum]
MYFIKSLTVVACSLVAVTLATPPNGCTYDSVCEGQREEWRFRDCYKDRCQKPQQNWPPQNNPAPAWSSPTSNSQPPPWSSSSSPSNNQWPPKNAPPSQPPVPWTQPQTPRPGSPAPKGPPPGKGPNKGGPPSQRPQIAPHLEQKCTATRNARGQQSQDCRKVCLEFYNNTFEWCVNPS